MGRNNTRYKKSLREQIYDRLKGMLSIGESKMQAKRDGTDRDKIAGRTDKGRDIGGFALGEHGQHHGEHHHRGQKYA